MTCNTVGMFRGVRLEGLRSIGLSVSRSRLWWRYKRWGGNWGLVPVLWRRLVCEIGNDVALLSHARRTQPFQSHDDYTLMCQSGNHFRILYN